MYLADGYSIRLMTKELRKSISHILEYLSFYHSEADTHIVSHLFHIGKKHSDTTIVKSPDMFILLVALCSKLPDNTKLWYQTGKVSPKAHFHRYVSI